MNPLDINDDSAKQSTIILTTVPLAELLSGMRQIVKDELQSKQRHELEEKLLSPAEAVKLFQPKISTVTLSAWTKAGHLKSYRIGGRVYYKLSEVLSSLTTLKRYKRAHQSS